jgi:hypothetical protein
VHIIKRAKDHAPQIAEVILALAGAVILEKDRGLPLYAGTYRGHTANVLRATIRGKDYVFSYNHDDGQVVIKRGNNRGPIVGEFDNQTRTKDIIRIFRHL